MRSCAVCRSKAMRILVRPEISR
uniref:Uncharacterized protein n=1 Tax=Toxoplasma gondii (strain ATCC 50861 / VEG) TaxID=432359 RepID=A0A0F7UY27_TOXGV|nr:TPA: hypothetical protein BN1205_090615 [Toxoplasma gondii VEG]